MTFTFFSKSFLLFQDSTAAAHLHSKQLLKEKVEQLERSLAEEESKHAQSKQLYLEKQRELETNLAELTNGLAIAQRNLQDKSNILI